MSTRISSGIILCFVSIAFLGQLSAQTTLAVSPGSLAFSAAQGSGSPPSKFVSVTSTPTGVAVSASVSPLTCSWLGVAPSGPTTPLRAVISVDSTGLSMGTYSCSAVFASGAATASVQVTLTVTPPVCRFSATPTSVSTVAAAGGSTTFNITASPAGCSGGFWSASVTDPTWMTISPATGTSAGSATATYAANSSSSSRSGTVTIANQSIPIIQSGVVPPCQFSVTPTSVSTVAATGGSTAFTVTAGPSGCSGGSWTASVSDSTWMTISLASGTAAASVTATYSPNSSTSPRSGTVAIAGQSITINQAATPPSPTCQFSASPTSVSTVPATGGSMTFTVTSGPTGCSGGSWTASVTDSTWMTISPTTGTSSASIIATYTANNGTTPRSGSLTIAGTTIAITQSAASAPLSCSFSATPTSVAQISAKGGSTTFTITGTPTGCSGLWTAAVSDSTWMEVSPVSGTSAGSVTAAFAPNTSATPRSGTVTIAGLSVAINQAGATPPTCVFSATPSSVPQVPAGGGSTTFSVSAGPSGCIGGSWTASVSDPGWMTVSPASGTAAGSFLATYLANTGAAARSGTISLSAQNIAITQAGTVIPPAVKTTALPSALVGTAYSFQLAAGGGTPPYSGWAVAGGSLPPGLTLDSSSGAIGGSPSTAAGSPFSFAVTVKDSLGSTSAPQSLSIAIATITTSSIPGAIANVVYPATAFGAAGGTAPYQWSLTSGALPGSMTFSSGGVLSGTPSGSGSFPFAVSVKDSSNPPLTLSANFTLSVAQPQGTLLSVSAQSLSFSYIQGDSNLPPSQNIGVMSNPTGTAVSASSTTSDGGSWLNVSPSFSPGNKTPGTVTVSVDPSKLVGPNTYSGQVTIGAPNASPAAATVNISLQVSPPLAPQLSIAPAVQTFVLPQGGQGQGSVVVSNNGGGALSYGVAVDSDAGWLSVNGSSVGIVSLAPTSIALTVKAPGSLSLGFHSGQITVTDLSSGRSQVSNVALLVNGAQPTMQLSQSGLTFYAVANAPAPPSQSLAIFNLGTGAFSWSTQIKYASATQGWLNVTPSGSSASATPGGATVAVNPSGLAKGQYYATVSVQSSTAANAPQTMSVLLNVVGAGELGSAPQLSSSGMILASPAGSATAATQSLTLFSPAGANLNYSTSVFTSEGGNWLSVASPTGSLGTSGVGSLTAQASAAGVSSGVHYGTIQVAFSEGTIQTVQVILIALPAITAGQPLSMAAGWDPAATPSCTPKTLAATFMTPGKNAPLRVGEAQTFQVQIQDDCSGPLLASQSPTAQLFSNGALLANLSTDNANGIWVGSWTPTIAQADVPVRVYASRGLAFGGISTPPNAVVDVVVLPANTNTAAQPKGAVNGASFDTSNPGLVAPGGYVSIFGDRMADNVAQGGTPLPSSLGNAQLLLGGQALPLLAVSAGQVNGLIPQGVPLYSNIQLAVQRGDSVSVPVSVYVTDLLPGIFTTAQTGTGQGSILIDGTASVAGPSAPGQQPVSRGQYIQIYATGLGRVVGPPGSTPPGDGQPAPPAPALFTTAATPTVTIGGVNAPVVFAGLAPGFVALYQVNAQVPSNAPVGSAVEVILTMTHSDGSKASSQRNVTIAVQ